MEQKPSKQTPHAIWGEYQSGVQYNENINLYSTVKKNEEFYIGEQWKGVNAPDLDKPTFNILRRTVSYFIASIVSEDIVVNIQPFDSLPTNKIVMDMLSGQMDEVVELCNFKHKARYALRNSAVDGDGCIHYFFNPGPHKREAEEPKEQGEIAVERPDLGSIVNGITGLTQNTLVLEGERNRGTPGVIEAELVHNTNVIFGNPEVQEVQKQPYIILAFRRKVDEVKKTAKENGGEPENIKPDQNIPPMEEDKELSSNKVTVIRKYYKKNGTVHFVECTSEAMVREDKDTGYKLYPVAWMPWERVKNRYHGQAAITGMIPNQIFINKLWAMGMQNVKLQAFPKIAYDRTKIPGGWNNQVGAAIPVTGDPNVAIAAPIQGLNMSSQVMELIEKCMQYTRDTMGASEAAFGEVKPDNTSAIIAVQRATAMPLELNKMEYYDFVEQSARIWLDMMGVNYGNRLVSVMGENGWEEKWFDFEQIQGMNLRLNVDVGSGTYWSEIAEMQTLDNMLMNQIIPDAKSYIELMPSSSLTNKQRLLEVLKEQEIEQREAAMQQMAMNQMAMDQGTQDGMGAVTGIAPENLDVPQEVLDASGAVTQELRMAGGQI